MLPESYTYPAAMRATRALLWRRMHHMCKRAALLAHIQNISSQYNLPAVGKKIASQANRTGMAEHFADPTAQNSIEVDLALLDHYDRLRADLEWYIAHTATQHDAHIFYRLRSGPGIGKIWALVLLDEIHDIHRCPRVQAFVSSRRLVKCTKESAGKRSATSGAQVGHADL
jgi:hypothetical protein